MLHRTGTTQALSCTLDANRSRAFHLRYFQLQTTEAPGDTSVGRRLCVIRVLIAALRRPFLPSEPPRIHISPTLDRRWCSTRRHWTRIKSL